MTELEFLKRWEAEKSAYDAWGRYVSRSIYEQVEIRILPKSIDHFLKIPPVPRLKESSSLLDKAFYRPNKKYTNPYEQITDKVGVRFVVLLTTDIQTIAEFVENHTKWDASRDRDYEQEKEKNPELFGYQSVHFVVRPKYDLKYEDTEIHAGMPCEVQIRTLLQHAHSELTHDTIYKPKTIATSRAKRFCAQSMALIEAVDDYFLKVFDEINMAEQPMNQAVATLESVYRTVLSVEPEPSKLNFLLLDAYSSKFTKDIGANVSGFLEKKPFLPDLIKKHAQDRHLFRQPAILLIYCLADYGSQETREMWPLTPTELQPVYDDLGISFEV